MKKIFTVLLLITLSLTVMGNTVDAKKVVEDPVLEEQPVALLVSCPPGVPCDDQGGGDGGGYVLPYGHSFEDRGEEDIYTKYWSNVISIEDFDESNWTPSVRNSALSFNDRLHFKIGDTVDRDECLSNELRIREFYGGSIGITYDYNFSDESFYYRDRYYQTAFGQNYHSVHEVYSECQRYDVAETFKVIPLNGIVVASEYERMTLVSHKSTQKVYIPLEEIILYSVANQMNEQDLDFVNMGIASIGLGSSIAQATSMLSVVGVAAFYMTMEDTYTMYIQNEMINDYNSLLTEVTDGCNYDYNNTLLDYSDDTCDCPNNDYFIITFTNIIEQNYKNVSFDYTTAPGINYQIYTESGGIRFFGDLDIQTSNHDNFIYWVDYMQNYNNSLWDNINYYFNN